MKWVDNLKGDNFLAVLDVMIDIKNEIEIMADEILIPILQTKIKFPDLLPMDSINMRDRYGNIRWKATQFLEKNRIIEGFKIHDGSHRWYSLLEITVEKEKFLKEYNKIKEKFNRRKEIKIDVDEMIKRRFQFLHEIYDLSNADINRYYQSYKVGEKLGYSNKLTTQVIQYLEKEGLIKFRTDAMTTISITHEGIKEVEQALTNPNEATEHFSPAKNIIINIKEMTDSQIQIESPYAIQSKTSNKELLKKLTDLNECIKKGIEKLELKDDEKQELEADVQTIDAQLSSPKPKMNILKTCVSSIRRIMEGAFGQIIASQVLGKLPVIEEMLRNS